MFRNNNNRHNRNNNNNRSNRNHNCDNLNFIGLISLTGLLAFNLTGNSSFLTSAASLLLSIPIATYNSYRLFNHVREVRQIDRRIDREIREINRLGEINRMIDQGVNRRRGQEESLPLTFTEVEIMIAREVQRERQRILNRALERAYLESIRRDVLASDALDTLQPKCARAA